MIKKINVFLVTLLAATSLLGGAVLAQDRLCDEVTGASASSFCDAQNNADDSSIIGNGSILNTAITLLTTVAGVIAVVMVIVGGIMYTVSNGDAGRASRGRSTIIYALVGLVVAVSARYILLFILDRIA